MRILLIALFIGTLFFTGCSSCSRDTEAENTTEMPSATGQPTAPKTIKIKPMKLHINKQLSPKLIKTLVNKRGKKGSCNDNNSQEKPDTTTKK